MQQHKNNSVNKLNIYKYSSSLEFLNIKINHQA